MFVVKDVARLASRIASYSLAGADPGHQVGGVIKQMIAREARAKFLATPTFVKTTPTLLPRTRQTARDVNGTRLFHRTNRFLAIFCVRSRFIG